MQKKVTSNGFTRYFLKMFLTVLVLGISLGISFAQGDEALKAREGKQQQGTSAASLTASSDVPLLNKPTGSKTTLTAKQFPAKKDAFLFPSTTSSNIVEATATFTGSLGTGDCVIPFRLTRDGIDMSCGVTKPYPGTAGGPAHYADYYSVTNTTGAEACITVTLTTTDLTNANLMVGSYLGSFNPANMATNWLASTAFSTGTPATGPLVHGYNLPAGATVVILVLSANDNSTVFGTAANYTLTVDGIPSACVASSVPTITGSTSICTGGSTTLSIGCGSALNSATDWKWYTASCGGTLVGTGKSITVTPAATTTYYVRGEGGCVTPGACGSVTVTVTAPPSASVLSQVTLPPVTTTVFSQNFDVAIPLPAGWSQQNLSQSPGLAYIQGNPANYVAHSGAPNSYISALWSSTTLSVGTISNWLFMPAMTNIKAGDVLTFWTRTSNTIPDRLQIRLNITDGTADAGTTTLGFGKFTELLLDINPAYTSTGYPTAWTQYTVTIPVNAANARLAFRYFVENGGADGANSNCIGIDDVSYTTLTPGAPPTTCTGSTANLQVNITGGLSPYTVTITPTSPAGPAIVVPNYISGSPIPVTPGVTTTYALTSVVSAAGCAGTGNSGTPTITVSATTIAPITIKDDPGGTLCAGNPKLLTAMEAGTPVTFSSGAAAVAIPGTGTGSSAAPAPASVYPINNTVSGLPTSNVAVKSVTVRGLSHTFMSDVNIVLQSPTGQNVVIMADVGRGGDFANHTLTFDDAAPLSLNNTVGGTNPPASGTTWKPTNLIDYLFPESDPDNWPAPGPGTSATSTTLSTFSGNPNGVWKMYIADDGGGDVGSLTGGYDIVFTPYVVPAGYTYTWSPATGLSSTTTNPVAASPMTTTTYQVFATAPSGCQTTATITINVDQLPSVTTPPAATTVCEGNKGTFTAVAAGAGATYQWQVSTAGVGGPYTDIANGGVYAGVTTGTLTVGPVTNAMNGWYYRLRVSGTCPPNAFSTGARLTVNAAPVITITAASTCGGVAGINGTQLTASSPTGGNFTWSPAAGLYTNAAATTAYVAGTPAATVYAAPTSNTVYTVTATNATTGCIGTKTATVNFTPAAPVVTPASATICLGQIQKLEIAPNTITATASPNITIPDASLTGITSTVNISGVPSLPTDISVKLNITHAWTGDLVVVLRAPNGAILNLDYYLSFTGGTGATTGFSNTEIAQSGVNVLGTGLNPWNGKFAADRITLATQDPAFPCGPNGMLPTTDLWSALTAGPFGNNGNGPWTLGIYDGGATDIGVLNSWTLSISYGAPPLGVWTPAAGLFTDAAATTPYVAGTPAQTVYASPAVTTTYSVTLSNGACVSPPRLVPITVNTPISFTTQPVNRTVCTDGTTSFTVVAAGTAPVHHWRVSANGTGNPGTWVDITNGGIYSGATTATLTITNPPVSLSGALFQDSVTTAPCAGLKSNNARLVVNPLPIVTISAFPSTSLMPGTTTTITSTSTPAGAIYQWYLNGILVAGSGPTLPVTVDQLGMYTLRVTDVNGCSNVSNSLLLTDSVSGKVFVYPSPNNGVFQVRYYSALNNSGLARGLNIYDEKGARVYMQKYNIATPYGRMDVDMRKFGTGTYWIEVVDVNGNRLAMGRTMIMR